MLYWSFHIGCFFLFKQKSAYETRISDWSSDVCSSDLILPPRFNRYAGGGEYGFHVDGAVMQLAEGEQLRSDLSCTLFLNDPGDYEGGRLIVSDTFGEHDIALHAGDAILYPSSSLHRVEPVTRGARLASFFWIQSLVRDKGQRQMLFETDTAIQKLTQIGKA